MTGPFDSLKKLLGLQSTALSARGSDQNRVPIPASSPSAGSTSFPLPHGTDWTWRPELWCTELMKPEIDTANFGAKLGAELKLFHDCTQAEIALRQIQISTGPNTEGYGLSVDVAKFDGSFLSLVLDLPQDALTGLQNRHVVRVAMKADLSSPLDIFTRLNIKHGPNTEQLVRQIALSDEEAIAEFDLGYSDLNEQRLERAWVDLIVNKPEGRTLTVQDLTLCRYPRAEI
ncbi:hypothetical protein ROA7450_00618 [Roseovarius albus]|uniref:Uncharacterized protein n=1 Tax=Roseovarius albus TaxID=1247867 RepID=A0A1X6YEY6_9RHOB|nr:DUF6478 family protein [Roseovarius albus]SLN19420.1 hypothetical protein ROA7450_00618 [Roseovarius albus]